MATDFQRNNEQAACSLVDRLVMIYVDPPEVVKDKNDKPIPHPETGEPLMTYPVSWIDNEVATSLKDQAHDNPFDEDTDMEAGAVKIDLQVLSRYGKHHKVNTIHHGRPKKWAAQTEVGGLKATWVFSGKRGWLCEDSEGHRVLRLPNGNWRVEKDEKKVIKAKKAKKAKKKDAA